MTATDYRVLSIMKYHASSLKCNFNIIGLLIASKPLSHRDRFIFKYRLITYFNSMYYFKAPLVHRQKYTNEVWAIVDTMHIKQFNV